MRLPSMKLAGLSLFALLTVTTSIAEAQGVLTIGRREDSTTFDPIATAQNVDFWVFMNMHDQLVRVDKTGTKLVPGLAESWEVSADGLTYTFKVREAKFSDGSPLTASDVKFTLERVRDHESSLWSDSYKVITDVQVPDDRTVVFTLAQPSAPFLASLAMPGTAILSEQAVKAMGDEAFAENPVVSGAFKVKEWRRGEVVILEKNPMFWEADRVKLDGIEWHSIVDDNTRMLKIQAGELDAAIFVPFSRVKQLKEDPNLVVHLDPSTREDMLIINHEKGMLGDVRVRQALDFAINKQEIVDAITFGAGEVAYSYVPKGALYHYADNLRRPHDVEKAKALLAEAGAGDLTITFVVNAGDEVDEQIAVLIQQQLAQAGVTVDIRKQDPSTTWDTLVAGDYDVMINYWTNDVIDPDQKTTWTLGHDANLNFYTRYNNDKVKDLVAAARVEMDPVKREAMYIELQKLAKEDVVLIDLYYSPYRNVSRKNIEGFYQNPLGRFFLEDTVKG